MTSHELAKKLLEGPDLTVTIYDCNDQVNREVRSVGVVAKRHYLPANGDNDTLTYETVHLNYIVDR